MKFDKFVDFNSYCPLCGERLTLYLQLFDSMCFRAEKIGDRTYKFTQSQCKNPLFEGDYLTISYKYDDKKKLILNTTFSSTALEEKVFDSKMYFFYMCNSKGFKEIENSFGSNKDYEIRIYYGCYYRDTPVFYFLKDKNQKISVISTEEGTDKLVNSTESFAVTKIKNNVERVYLINMNYEVNHTMLWHYTVNEEQAKMKDYKPNILEKELPMLKTRPKLDLKNRENLLDRFDSWILMS